MAASNQMFQLPQFESSSDPKANHTKMLIIEDLKLSILSMARFMVEKCSFQPKNIHFAIDAEDARRRFIYIMINAKLAKQKKQYEKIITPEMMNDGKNYDLIYFDVNMPQDHYTKNLPQEKVSELNKDIDVALVTAAKEICRNYAPNSTVEVMAKPREFNNAKSMHRSPEIFQATYFQEEDQVSETQKEELQALIQAYLHDFTQEYLDVYEVLSACRIPCEHHLGPAVMRQLSALEDYFDVKHAKKIFFSTEPLKDFIRIYRVLDAKTYKLLQRDQAETVDNLDKGLTKDITVWNKVLSGKYPDLTPLTEEQIHPSQWLIEGIDFDLITPVEIKKDFSDDSKALFKDILRDKKILPNQSDDNQKTTSTTPQQNPNPPDLETQFKPF